MKHYNKLEEFLDGELLDYPFFKYEIDFDEECDGWEYYFVKVVTLDRHQKVMGFRVDENTIQVQMSEDYFEEVEPYGWKIKYFWLALLSWEIGVPIK